MNNTVYPRAAWVEIDTQIMRDNFAIIEKYAPAHLKRLCVVKDNAYGHGAIKVAQMAIESGFCYLAVETIAEAVALRDAHIRAPLLLFGEASPAELPYCLEYDITIGINHLEQAQRYNQLAQAAKKVAKVQVEIDTGMSRWGVPCAEAVQHIAALQAYSHLQLEGLMSHFAMSDEADKSYALFQLAQFKAVVTHPSVIQLQLPYIHMSNTGGLLDLPDAHFSMIRCGILPLGIYPSLVCNQYPGIKPVMSVKAKIMALRDLQKGQKVGYGMHFTADKNMTIASLPIGYGDGYPRVRNEGYVLIAGKRCPVIGGNAMDAMMVDVTHLDNVKLYDEVVLMGNQGNERIDPRDLVPWKKTVCYEILTNWRARLPRIYV